MQQLIVVGVAAAYLVITAIGWFGNGCIVIATILSKRLHGPCNAFIAIEAFCEILHQSGHIITAYRVYHGKYIATAEQCFNSQVIPNFFMNVGNFLNLCIGIDRLFAILYPFM
ncbi:unnamed protein product [Gongylonema pulchrum]|uniref:G_PROTEIN_RECEP_F1_2 domain-containing protein n=1 Tax=Gongylonema pulchrum TaxID=637853 RepID=A0A183ERB1_9BILA|nr:unnamed protein product [Gongylonema pulchrum]